MKSGKNCLAEFAHKTIIVVQARMGSTRLPGKSLMPLKNGLSLIEMVLMRLMKSEKASKIILATSRNQDCNRLEEKANAIGCDVIRGDEHNVLSRFTEACRKYSPDGLVRVCADNPFIAPSEIDNLISYFYKGNYDYACNNVPESGLPDGFGAEIVKPELLINIEKDPDDATKEHVTQFIIDNSIKYRTGLLKAENELCHPDIKLDIDTDKDYARIIKLCGELTDSNCPFWTCDQIINTYRRVFQNG